MKELFVVQDVGGVGKTTLVRGIAEAVPDIPIIEVESVQRIREYDRDDNERRVTHFAVRADRAAIEATGGLAARQEFDSLTNNLIAARTPHLVDIGANTSSSFLGTFDQELANAFSSAEIELGILVVLTADPAALAEGAKLLALSKAWVSSRFIVENQIRGHVAPEMIRRVAGDASITTLAKHELEPKTTAFLQATGLHAIPRLTAADFAEEVGFNQARRMVNDLKRFRLAVMEAVRPAAEWLAS